MMVNNHVEQSFAWHMYTKYVKGRHGIQFPVMLHKLVSTVEYTL